MSSISIKTPVPGPRSRRYLKALHRCECSHVTFGGKEFPVFIDKAEGVHVTDVDGNRYLDLTAFFAVSNLGHASAPVARAMCDAAGRGWHAMGDVHPHVLKLKAAQALTRYIPGDFSHCFFSSNGSDAVETAFKTAFLHTKRPGVVAFEGAYHGLGYGAMQATHRPHFRDPFIRQSGSFVCFGAFVAEGEAAQEQRMRVLGALDMYIRRQPKVFGAMIIEPIQGRAGIRQVDAGFLKGLKAICRRRGLLLIFDEIYTGFGRTGKRFAFEHYGVRPDILCLGKGIANGFPLSACVSTSKIMAAWGPSPGEAKHTSTFLGNPLGSAMMLAVLDEIKKRGLVKQVEEKGYFLRKKLENLKTRYPQLIGEVRGRGLMLGLVFKKKGAGPRVMKQLLKRGILILTSGPDSEVLTFTPPFVITKKELSLAVETLQAVLDQKF